MKSFFLYILRSAITPLLIAIVVIGAYLLGWATTQTSVLVLLVVSGLIGQSIKYVLEVRYNKKSESEQEDEEEEPKDPISELPQDVQDLIREGETVQREEGLIQEEYSNEDEAKENKQTKDK